jgi:hypothetical protein
MFEMSDFFSKLFSVGCPLPGQKIWSMASGSMRPRPRIVSSFILGCFFLTAIQGCSSATKSEITDKKVSLADLQAVAEETLPIGFRKRSQNGRVYSSEYFVMEKGFPVTAGRSDERRYVDILILGDRRPYVVEVKVYVETKVAPKVYRQTGSDQGLARVTLRRFQKNLELKKRDRDVIDDFRVF